MREEAKTLYVSCACNRVPHSADWGRNGLICYAACHAVAIYDPYIAKIGRVIQTLHRHKDRINNVRWIRPRYGKEFELLSCSADGTAVVWSKVRDRFECTAVVKVDEVLTICNSLYLDDESSGTGDHSNFVPLLICTGGINGELKLWERNSQGDVNSVQTLVFGRKLPIEACFARLPGTDAPILAVAIEDWSIQLYIKDSDATEQLQFNKVQTLTGHTDWVRCMDFGCVVNNSILLASGSQDAMIRLWKISVDTKTPTENELYRSKQDFVANHVKYNIALESVLYAHEGWVYGIHWCPTQKENQRDQPMKLLSCSLDKSMIIWEPDSNTGLWSEKVRVGEVGGNSLGFYGCKFSGDGQNIMAHGYQGSFHIWNYSREINNWLPRSVPSGHFGQVVDLCWDPNGRFLVSASTDQTTRIHAPWMDQEKELWHEIGRPQVHGYDMACLIMLTPYMFASGAEEKVVRIFTAPSIFKNQLMKIANVDDFENMTADSATVPALGLTNKATFNQVTKVEESNVKSENYSPPTEEELMQNTLWPELQKLYGHGYEIFSIAATHNGSLLATACRSTSPEHAAILIWDIETWAQTQKLMSHQLTVTQMEFSPDDKYLLSVSRDRRWSLFERQNSSYSLIVASSKKDSVHSRIIWCCAWTHDSCYFATGSRDGKVGVWDPHFENKNVLSVTSLWDTNNLSVTALCFAPWSVTTDSYILAIGYDIGHIEVHKLVRSENSFAWLKYAMYDTAQAHHLTVRRLKFRPRNDSAKDCLQLASAGSDDTVKIYSLAIQELQEL